MALTQIRDIAFTQNEPENRYNLWLHFREKRVLVLEMWVNGQWMEVTNGNINVPYAPDPQPEPPAPTPSQNYPQFNFEDSENNLQVISEIESTYATVNLNGEFGNPAVTYDVLGTYNSITHTIVTVIDNTILVFTINTSTGEITITSTYNLNSINNVLNIKLQYNSSIYANNSIVKGRVFPFSAKRVMINPNKTIINGNDMGNLSVEEIVYTLLQYINTSALIYLEIERNILENTENLRNTLVTRYVIDYNNYDIDTEDLSTSSLKILFKRISSRKDSSSITQALDITEGLSSGNFTTPAIYNSFKELENEWLYFCIEHSTVNGMDNEQTITTDYNLYTLIANLNEPIVYTPKASLGEIESNSVPCTINGYVESYIKDIYSKIRIYYKLTDERIDDYQPDLSHDDYIEVQFPGNVQETANILLSTETGEHTQYIHYALGVWIDAHPTSYVLHSVYTYDCIVAGNPIKITYTNE